MGINDEVVLDIENFLEVPISQKKIKSYLLTGTCDCGDKCTV